MRAAVAALLLQAVCAKVVDLEVDAGALADTDNHDTWVANKEKLQTTLASLQPGDTLVIPNKTFYVMGGVRVDKVRGVTIKIEGTLSFSNDMKTWPRDPNGDVQECFYGQNWEDVTFTSSGTGTLDGRGATWWGYPGIGYLELGENRPRLFHLWGAKRTLVENLLFKDSPYWTFWLSDTEDLEVRYCEVNARRDHTAQHHDLIELSAFNTDGFDVSGKNVWIHDVKIWNQDDCIAAKGSSINMVFERIEASGLGMTIGSIGDGPVRNITFRDVYMKNTVKGIYTKFRDDAGIIEDVVFENFYMEKPSQYAIWIGPAQQSDSSNPCAAHPCSLCWPQMPGSKCDPAGDAKYINITLRNITVNNAESSPGLLLAGPKNPMKDVVFEDVFFINPGTSPFSDYYHCNNVDGGIAKGKTWPIPGCFRDETGTCQHSGECQKPGFSCCNSSTHSTRNCPDTHRRCGCIADGDCTTYEDDCCSRKSHYTGQCGAAQRCGCVGGGSCATHTADCCSGKGHRTLACDIGGFRCEGDSDIDNVDLVV